MCNETVVGVELSFGYVFKLPTASAALPEKKRSMNQINPTDSTLFFDKNRQTSKFACVDQAPSRCNLCEASFKTPHRSTAQASKEPTEDYQLVSSYEDLRVDFEPHFPGFKHMVHPKAKLCVRKVPHFHGRNVGRWEAVRNASYRVVLEVL